MDVGLRGQIGAGLKGGTIVNASGSIGGSAGVNWSRKNSESVQHSVSGSENFTQNTGYSQNVENVFRGVAEGHYRASTEEGQRILDSISTSLDRADQEQQQTSVQFQKAETYRKIASISEEQAASINANATQEFMNEIQKEQSLRSIEKTMVNHPEQAQERAEKFVQEKVGQYFQNFKEQENISVGQPQEKYREDSQLMEKQAQENAPELFYQSDKSSIHTDAESVGFKNDNFVDKRPAENVGKLIVEKSLETENNKDHLTQIQEDIKNRVKKIKEDI